MSFLEDEALHVDASAWIEAAQSRKKATPHSLSPQMKQTYTQCRIRDSKNIDVVKGPGIPNPALLEIRRRQLPMKDSFLAFYMLVRAGKGTLNKEGGIAQAEIKRLHAHMTTKAASKTNAPSPRAGDNASPRKRIKEQRFIIGDKCLEDTRGAAKSPPLMIFWTYCESSSIHTPDLRTGCISKQEGSGSKVVTSDPSVNGKPSRASIIYWITRKYRKQVGESYAYPAT
ncbi:hypothetical protein SCHPADRAFT_895100 [Schizopora paradoxa]|uniref:Uncharacterized protein n=1 Tax=Schizopora paradoxa TaxID=27342 RepID=A0A0H2R6A2_9AGAM|nr:hypothetical protein SCHPADRAFT_895100 [Schizopora paradoxa]